MTLQTETQRVVINLLPNTSKSKSNQTMKFGQSIEYNVKNIFLQKLSRKWGKRASSKPLLDFQKMFIWMKSKWLPS